MAFTFQTWLSYQQGDGLDYGYCLITLNRTQGDNTGLMADKPECDRGKLAEIESGPT